MRHSGKFLYQSGFAIAPVDTTGAGDTFCGVLIAALAQGSDAAGALERACAAAALACLQPGAQSSIPESNAVDAFLATQPSATVTDITALRDYCASAAQ